MKYFISLLVLFSLNSKASFLLEPYGGVNFASNWVADGETDKDPISGGTIGGRAGVQRMGFMMGLDGKISSWDLEGNIEEEIIVTSYGLFIGYDFPILLRVWGTYVFGGTGTVEDVGEYLNPTGHTFGIGYKIFPFISLNFESGSIKFTEFESEDGTNTEREDTATYYLLSISIPLTIGI